MSTHFKIIIPVYNAEPYIQNALISVMNQDYDNFECIITDDYSTDNTVDVVDDFIYEHALEDYFHLRRNQKRMFALYNLYSMMLSSDADDEDVYITLDGDDWLAGNDVLSKLDQIYTEDDCWLTYGSYVVYPSGQDSSFHVTEYHHKTIKSGDFRKDPQWRASHLRTFKHKLARHIQEEDLIDEDGSYYRYAYDQALMFPMMEMARERIRFVSDILCVYNDENPMNVHKIEPQVQIDMAERVRNNHEKKDKLLCM